MALRALPRRQHAQINGLSFHSEKQKEKEPIKPSVGRGTEIMKITAIEIEVEK